MGGSSQTSELFVASIFFYFFFTVIITSSNLYFMFFLVYLLQIYLYNRPDITETNLKPALLEGNKNGSYLTLISL